MSQSRIDSRYAKALYDSAKGNNAEEAVYSDMSDIIYLYLNSPDFKRFLKNPAISPLKKVRIIHNILESSFNKLTLAFLSLITRKSRLANILGIAKSYMDIFREEKNICLVTVITAKDVTADEQADLCKKIEVKLDRRSIIVFKTDETLIGGVKIQYDNKEFDDTLVNKLRKIRSEFHENPHLSKL